MIWIPCPDECAKKNDFACRDDGARAFELVEEDETELMGKMFHVRCSNCGGYDVLLEDEWKNACADMDRRAASTRRAGLTKFPFVEPHTGQVVNSHEDIVRVTKAHGLHAAEHGINDAYNDELCDKLKTKNRDRKEKLKKLRRETREILKASRIG